MTKQGHQVLADALKLGPIERAELVEQLLASFPFPERERIDALWAAEAEARVEAYERGDIGSASVAAVLARIEKRAD